MNKGHQKAIENIAISYCIAWLDIDNKKHQHDKLWFKIVEFHGTKIMELNTWLF